MNSLCKRINSSMYFYRTIHRTQALPACLYHTVNNKSNVNLKPASNYTYSVIRCKSKKHQQKDPESDDENDKLEYINDDDFTLSKDSKVVKFNTTSLRTDMILKSSLGIARNKIEQLFYESKIRVNGRKILKKSVPIQQDYDIIICAYYSAFTMLDLEALKKRDFLLTIRQDYELDIIKSFSPKNPDHIYVARVIVLNIVPKEESIAVTVRRFKNLLIENYEEDPHKGTTEE